MREYPLRWTKVGLTSRRRPLLRIDQGKLVEAAFECEAVASFARLWSAAARVLARRPASWAWMRASASAGLTGLEIHSTTPGGMFSQFQTCSPACRREDADHGHRILRTVAQQFAAERDRIAAVADELEQNQVDLRILLQKRPRLADVLGCVDRVELLRIERVEEKATIVAIGGDDEDGSAGAFVLPSADPAAIAQARAAHWPSRRVDMRSTRASISSGNAELAGEEHHLALIAGADARKSAATARYSGGLTWSSKSISR